MNNKGISAILFNDFCRNISSLAERLSHIDKEFYYREDIFENSRVLGEINKEKYPKQKNFLQK